MQELLDIRDLHAGPWMVVGDFNLLVNHEDKSNERVNWHMLARFRSKLNILELKELYLNVDGTRGPTRGRGRPWRR